MPFLLILGVLIQSFCFAISEVDYKKVFAEKVAPYYFQSLPQRFLNAQKMELHYSAFIKSGNTKTLVIVPGRAEPIKKYSEVIYDLRNDGFNIFIMDVQGQGGSQRILKDTQKGYVTDFYDYVRDMDAFMKEIVIPQSKGKKIYLLAHSMGGTIAALYMTFRPAVFEKAVLSAPMFEVNTEPYSERMATLIAQTMVIAQKGTFYAKGRGPYVPEEDTLELYKVSHSPVRFDAARETRRTEPGQIIAGPTYRWVYETLKATRGIHKKAHKIITPMLIFQAGEDVIVKPNRQNNFCGLSKNCRMLVFPNAWHEILMETDPLRERAFIEIRKFFL